MADYDETFWALDPALMHLNHGSFGACPRPVLAVQSDIRARMEAAPTRFYVREFQPLLDAARSALAGFVGADPEDLAFVPNATTGVNTVVRSLDLGPGDELLTTDHAYNACRNALDEVCARTGAQVVTAAITFPVSDPGQHVASVLAAVTPRTRLVLLDHVTSPTALVLDVAQLVAELDRRGIDTVIDGAHAPGMLPLDLGRLGAAYYTGNCHKWLCAPKGVGFLHVRPDRRDQIRPPVTSHGRNAPAQARSRFHLELDWTGTFDPSAALSVPAAIEAIGATHPDGWPGRMAANHALAVRARQILCDALGYAPACPESMLGSMAAIPLPPGDAFGLYAALMDGRHGPAAEVPVAPWPARPAQVLRVSAQAYNAESDYRTLAATLQRALRGDS